MTCFPSRDIFTVTDSSTVQVFTVTDSLSINLDLQQPKLNSTYLHYHGRDSKRLTGTHADWLDALSSRPLLVRRLCI